MRHLRTVKDVMTHPAIAVGREVTLSGTVPDDSLTDLFVRLARAVPGVVDVDARLDAQVPVH